jgi:hypothetical protein
MKKHIYPVILAIAIAVCFTGCGTSSTYFWGNYEPQVYAYLKGESPERLLPTMERDRERIGSNSTKAPPGFYAHLGLLYMETGNIAEAIVCFEMEKYLFPEAVTYMDFLLTNLGR